MSTEAETPGFWERRRQELGAVMRGVFGARFVAARPAPALAPARAACTTVWIPAPPREVERIG